MIEREVLVLKSQEIERKRVREQQVVEEIGIASISDGVISVINASY